MRCLLDEGVSPKLAGVLTTLGHPSEHVYDIGLGGASDQAVFEAAKAFDLHIALDLHRQAAEWEAARQAMQNDVRMLRLRFRASQPDDDLEQVRAVIWRWREIEERLASDQEVRLVTLSGQTYQLRLSTVDDLSAMPGPQSSS